jgi:NTE family protein
MAVMSLTRLVAGMAVALTGFGCSTIANAPFNQPTARGDAGIRLDAAAAAGQEGRATAETRDDTIIGLAFSGGGTRAAAFSFGVLQELDKTALKGRAQGQTLVDRVDFVSGVSGGSVTAAYFGLKKRAALGDFRERFLIRNAEESLNTAVNLINLGRGLGGGVNEDARLRNWLDANLFEGATFSALFARHRPTVWINATDIYNRTPFVFIPIQFSAICSDLAKYPISGAVAASAAVPVAFAPILLEPYPSQCRFTPPEWLTRAQNNPNASPLLRAFANGIQRHGDGTMKYIKLLDGGLADNYGLSGFTIMRESSQTPYGPLTPGEAVRLRRVLFLVVDAGNESKKEWAQKLEGPSGADLISAIADVSIDAASRSSYSAFEATTRNWRDTIVRWRCGLPNAEVLKLGGSGAHNCRDLKFLVTRVSFDQLGKERAEKLKAVPTRFQLPTESVDEVIAAGSEALQRNPTYRMFLSSP